MLIKKQKKNMVYRAITWAGDILKGFKLQDLPCEVMLELTDCCNIDCKFCFNKLPTQARGRKKELTTQQWKTVIDKISKASVPIVRFTGGEPLIREDIFVLMEYARAKGLKVWLNTNAALITRQNAARIVRYADNVLIPLNAYDLKGEYAITGYKYFKKKLKGICLLKKYGIKYLRCGTVATKNNIDNLERIHTLVRRLDVSDWELFREMPLFQQSQKLTRDNIAILVEKLLSINKKENKNYKIANALPFCSYDPEKVKKVALGAIADDGHIRFAVNARGQAKPMYYINENIGDILDLNIREIWNNPFMKKMRKLAYVPKACAQCTHLKQCKGGSRMVANITTGQYKGMDYLADPDRLREEGSIIVQNKTKETFDVF